MNAVSVKRSFVSERSASKSVVHRSEWPIALYALAAGILLLVIGAEASVDALMIAGFFVAISAGLALNALFWAGYYAKHGAPKIDLRSGFYE